MIKETINIASFTIKATSATSFAKNYRKKRGRHGTVLPQNVLTAQIIFKCRHTLPGRNAIIRIGLDLNVLLSHSLPLPTGIRETKQTETEKFQPQLSSN